MRSCWAQEPSLVLCEWFLCRLTGMGFNTALWTWSTNEKAEGTKVGSAFCILFSQAQMISMPNCLCLPLKQDGRQLMKPEILQMCWSSEIRNAGYSGGECFMAKQAWQSNIKQRSTSVFTARVWLRDFGALAVRSRFQNEMKYTASFSNLHGQKPYWP